VFTTVCVCQRAFVCACERESVSMQIYIRGRETERESVCVCMKIYGCISEASDAGSVVYVHIDASIYVT